MLRPVFALISAVSLLISSGWAEEGRGVQSLTGHGGPIMALSISQSGQLVSGSFDNAIGLWQDTTATWLEGHDAAVTALLTLPDGRIVSGSDDYTLRLWDGSKSVIIGEHQGKIKDLAASPDGRTVASAGWDGKLTLWSLTGEKTREFRLPGAVNAVAFDKEARLYSGTMTGHIDYFTPDGKKFPIISNGFGINRILLSEAEGWLAYGTVDGITRVLEPQSGAQIADFTLDRRPILAMAYSAAQHLLAVGDGDGYIMIVDTERWQIRHDFRAAQKGPIWALAFSQNGERLWAGGLDDHIASWTLSETKEFNAAITGDRNFLRDPALMSNGERQFQRKCSICHSLKPGPSRKAGPNLFALFGRKAGSISGYLYSATLVNADFIWDSTTIDALFDEGPDHYIPGSKMPMQRITGVKDRQDLIEYLKTATRVDTAEEEKR